MKTLQIYAFERTTEEGTEGDTFVLDMTIPDSNEGVFEKASSTLEELAGLGTLKEGSGNHAEKIVTVE